MPEIILYDHLKRKNYSLDFQKWLDAFNDNSSFFYDWRQKLYKAYSMLDYTTNTTDDCFQYDCNYNGERLLIHFNIGYIYQQCAKRHLLYLYNEKAPLSEFESCEHQTKYVFYSAINKKFLLHAISDFPVLCCTAPTYGRNCLLVIDGCHRITIKKKFHMKSVNVFEYQINSSYDFANVFEYYIFQFLLEYNNRINAAPPFGAHCPGIR